MKLLVFVEMTQIRNVAELLRRGATSTEIGSKILCRIFQLEILIDETSFPCCGEFNGFFSSILYLMDISGLAVCIRSL
jgi:hypothetical protein